MIKYALKKWDENKEVLRNTIQQTEKNMRSAWDYEEIVKLACRYIFNENVSREEPMINVDGITMIDNGDYQGTLLFMLPFDVDQPAEYEYLMTYVGYGSCSGCDTLQRIQADDEDDDETEKEMVDSYLGICKDIVSNTIRPYNQGWRNNGMFEPANSSSEYSITCIKMLTKDVLYDIMCSWVKPIIDNAESLGGRWSFGSYAGGFSWRVAACVGSLYRFIGARVCYDNEKVIVGFDICTDDMGNANIKIRENSIEFIEDSIFHDFTKEEIEDLYDVLKNHIMY